MNTKVYRQYDSRWGGLAYPTSNSVVSSDGCGLCAVTHCAIELNKYKDSTPKTFYSFMKNYAVAGNGTLWDGIDAGLNNFIGNSKRFNDMTSFWKEVNKGNRVGVILFRSGYGPDNTLWTTGGHYVAFTSYKYENNKHWLYTKDSGFRQHDGWYAYESSMRGCIQTLWTAEIPKNGWKKENNNWYYYKDGAKLLNTWIKDGKGWCLLDKNGKMLNSQWINYKNEWYYLKSNGYMAANEWAKDKTGWCYLNSEGKIVKSTWIKYNNIWYYIKSNGYMATSEWAQDSKKKWFYLTADGSMATSTWIKWKDSWYYLKDNGEMAVNLWVKDSKGWCYVGSDGKLIVANWIKWKNNWYYVDSQGHMLIGTHTIDGKQYTFDSTGKLI